MVTTMTENPTRIRSPRDTVSIYGSPIRLAQLVWKRNALTQFPIGPSLVVAMENWLTPVRVYDYYRAPARIREIFAETPVPQQFDANTIAQVHADGIAYIVVYNGRRKRERVWWSLAHEFGHIVLGHAVKGWHDRTANEREADMFAAELLLPMGAIQEIRRWPLYKIARTCGTSLEATRNRLTDLTNGWLQLYTTANIEEGRTRFIRPIGADTPPASTALIQEAPHSVDRGNGDDMVSKMLGPEGEIMGQLVDQWLHEQQLLGASAVELARLAKQLADATGPQSDASVAWADFQAFVERHGWTYPRHL